MTFYTVYVGNYISVPDCKKDQKKLNDMGYKGYVFSMGDYYSLRVNSFTSLDRANQIAAILRKYGLKAFVQ